MLNSGRLRRPEFSMSPIPHGERPARPGHGRRWGAQRQAAARVHQGGPLFSKRRRSCRTLHLSAYLNHWFRYAPLCAPLAPMRLSTAGPGAAASLPLCHFFCDLATTCDGRSHCSELTYLYRATEFATLPPTEPPRSLPVPSATHRARKTPSWHAALRPESPSAQSLTTPNSGSVPE